MKSVSNYYKDKLARNILFLLAVLILTTGCVELIESYKKLLQRKSATTTDTLSVFPEILRSLVKIRVLTDQKFDPDTRSIKYTYEYGTGIIVHTNGAILVANHTIQHRIEKGDNCIGVMFYDQPGKYFSVSITYENKDHDYAIVRTTRKEIYPYKKIDFQKESTLINEKVKNERNSLKGHYVIAGGFPGNWGSLFNATFSIGIIKNEQVNLEGYDKIHLEQEMIAFSAPIEKGFSGGPVLTLDGRIIGMVLGSKMSNGKWKDFSFALPISVIDPLLINE